MIKRFEINLNAFERIWANFNDFERIWASLSDFKRIWANLGDFEWVQAVLIEFKWFSAIFCDFESLQRPKNWNHVNWRVFKVWMHFSYIKGYDFSGFGLGFFTGGYFFNENWPAPKEVEKSEKQT